jgi:hypothetical protein
MNQEFSLRVKICEILPFDWTFYCQGGRCQKLDDYCSYQVRNIRNNSPDLIICRKKTTTTNPINESAA